MARSLLNVLVGLDSKHAVHDFVAVVVLDGGPRGVRAMVFDDGSGQAASEVVLLDQAFFQCAFSSEEFLNGAGFT